MVLSAANGGSVKDRCDVYFIQFILNMNAL